MVVIKINAASAAMFLSTSISAALLSVQSLVGVIPDIPVGIALVVLSLATVLLGITSISTNRAVINSLLFLLATVWMSVGVTRTWIGINNSHNITSASDDTEYLLPGYATSVIILLFFLIVSLYRKLDRFTAVLSVVCVVLFVFEIISIWVSWKIGGAIYITLALFLSYFWLSDSLQGFGQKGRVVPMDASSRTENQPKSHDYHIMWFVTNALSYAAFAIQVTTLSENTQYTFSWCLCSGLVQIILGVSSLRRHNATDGMLIMLFGLVWSAVGSNLWLDIIYWNLSLPLSVCVVLVVFFTTLTIVNIKLELLKAVSCFEMAIFMLALFIDGNRGTFVGTVAFIGFVVSLYGAFGHLSHITSFWFQVPLGTLLFEDIFHKCYSNTKVKTLNTKGYFSAEIMLGYAKYVDVQCLGFLVNAIATFSLIPNTSGHTIDALPFCLGFGGIVQFIVGFVAFSRGLTFESCSFLVYSCFWSIWGTVFILDLYGDDKNVDNISGCISFLVVGITLLLLSSTVNKIWLSINSGFCLIILSFIIEGVSTKSTDIFRILVSSIFALILLYAFLSFYLKNVFGREILPVGKPVLTISLLTHGLDKIVLTDSRKATGVQQIANMLNSGKICGIPTDTVYVLVAACNQPAAVERAYKTKKLAEDRPMSMWLSHMNQIQAAKKEFGPVLWDFLTEIWPSNISAVVKRGDWVNSLGLNDSGKYIGKPDSIAIRIPDNSITCHLIDLTGPIAVTSANPTGEADTTHHWQVIAKLGDNNCDGVLCDGPSPENAASTVVDCRNVDSGKLGFFRIGLTPKSTVENIFERVLKRHNMKADNGSDSGISSEGHNSTESVNGAFDLGEVLVTEMKNPTYQALNGHSLARSSSIIGGKPPSSLTKENPAFKDS